MKKPSLIRLSLRLDCQLRPQIDKRLAEHIGETIESSIRNLPGGSIWTSDQVEVPLHQQLQKQVFKQVKK